LDAAPGNAYPTPRGPLVTGRLAIVCVLAALVLVDYAERAYHRPLCVDACGGLGQDVASISHGPGRGLISTYVDCRCANWHHVRLDMARSEYLDWLAGQVFVTAGLLGILAAGRWLWRRRAGA
jgi:hypothetical protein